MACTYPSARVRQEIGPTQILDFAVLSRALANCDASMAASVTSTTNSNTLMSVGMHLVRMRPVATRKPWCTPTAVN